MRRSEKNVKNLMIDNFFPLKKSNPIFDRSDGSKRPIGDQPVENNSPGRNHFYPGQNGPNFLPPARKEYFAYF